MDKVAIYTRLSKEDEDKLNKGETSGKKFTPHLFSGRIKCLDCHSTMAKTSGRFVGGYDYFICQLAKKSKLAECTRHSIRYDELEIFISDEIKKLINRMLNYDNNIEDIRKYLKKDTKDKKKIEDNKTHLQNNINKIEELNNAISNLYLDKTKGVITEDDFINIKDNLSNEVKKLNDFNNILKEELKTLSIDDSKIDNFMDNVIKHKDFKELTFEIVNDFIECIYIPETNDGDERLIDIVWNV